MNEIVDKTKSEKSSAAPSPAPSTGSTTKEDKVKPEAKVKDEAGVVKPEVGETEKKPELKVCDY